MTSADLESGQFIHSLHYFPFKISAVFEFFAFFWRHWRPLAWKKYSKYGFQFTLNPIALSEKFIKFPDNNCYKKYELKVRNFYRIYRFIWSFILLVHILYNKLLSVNFMNFPDNWVRFTVKFFIENHHILNIFFRANGRQCVQTKAKNLKTENNVENR